MCPARVPGDERIMAIRFCWCRVRSDLINFYFGALDANAISCRAWDNNFSILSIYVIRIIPNAFYSSFLNNFINTTAQLFCVFCVKKLYYFKKIKWWIKFSSNKFPTLYIILNRESLRWIRNILCKFFQSVKYSILTTSIFYVPAIGHQFQRYNSLNI